MGKDCVTIPDELVIELDTNCKLELKKGKRISCGRNDLADIKWYTYRIENSNVLNLKYDCIALSFSKITKNMLEKAKENIFNTNVSTAARPNIDGITGNIHPSENKVEENKTGKIRQLVLCSDRGPITPHFIECKDYYCYNVVHKACYYPLICDDKSLYEDYRYKILQKVWNELGDEIVERKMKDEMEEEMKDMCNIAEGLVDEALEEGIQKSIKMMRKARLDDESITKLIMDEYNMSEEEVGKFM